MTVTVPPTIDALPPAPDPNDRATFNSRAYPWAAAQAVMTTQVSAVATNVYNNAEAAETAASSAVASASAASASASSASSDAQSAASDAGSAEAAWADFDKRYLGTKASEPTADNAGNPLAVGALYFNAVLGRLRSWNGAEWEAAYLPASGYQEKLVSGANIKKLNGSDLLGEGDLTVSFPVQEFNSSGMWNKPPGAQFVLVEEWAAGGGGASGSRKAANVRRDGGSGGGGGGYRKRLFKASELPDSVPVTIGLGGEGAPAATTNDSYGTEGKRGGNTSFGDLLTVYGGEGGHASGTPANGGGALDVGGEPANPNSTVATVGSFGSGTYDTDATGALHGQPSGDGGGQSGGHNGDTATAGDGGSSVNGAAGGGSGASITSSNVTYKAGDGGGTKGHHGNGAPSSDAAPGKQDATQERTAGGGGASGNIGGALGGKAVVGNGLYVVFSEYGGVSAPSITGPWTPFKTPFSSPNDAIWYGAQWVLLTTGALHTSPDLQTWEKRSAPDGTYGIAFGAGLYVAVTAYGTIYTSPDLATWTQRYAQANGLTAIKWSGSYFIAVGGGGVTLKSTDGIAWALVVAVSASHNLSDVEVSGTNIVATSSLTPYAVYSTNGGASWSVITTTLPQVAARITKSTSVWVIAAGSNVYYANAPASGWTLAADGQNDAYSDCVANGENYLFVSSNVDGRVGISSQGMATWVVQTYTAAYKAGDRGGNGAAPGGGGGGGGASTNGFDSGAGGPGADGRVRIFTW